MNRPTDICGSAAGIATRNTRTGFTNPYQYTGREADTPWLYYYRARYYSPVIASFISEDPLGFGGGQSSFYAYAGDNPISDIDPSGRLGLDTLVEAIVGGVANGLVNGLDYSSQGG